jgi:hypothetical protein
MLGRLGRKDAGLTQLGLILVAALVSVAAIIILLVALGKL